MYVLHTTHTHHVCILYMFVWPCPFGVVQRQATHVPGSHKDVTSALFFRQRTDPERCAKRPGPPELNWVQEIST